MAWENGKCLFRDKKVRLFRGPAEDIMGDISAGRENFEILAGTEISLPQALIIVCSRG